MISDVMGAPQLLLILVLSFMINLPIYGLANRNIAATAGRDVKNAFWLGLIGPLGTIICLFQCVDTTFKKIAFGIGRLFLWSFTVQILVELGFISAIYQPILNYIIGIPFILRGKNMFKFSTKESDEN